MIYSASKFALISVLRLLRFIYLFLFYLGWAKDETVVEK